MSVILTQDLLREHVQSRLREPQRSGVRRSARLISLAIRRSREQHPR
ncbi:MAG: hypothetical protein ACOYBY_00390 [Dermatophilaceae bacterium]